MSKDNYNTDLEILKDVNKNGKDNNWRDRHLEKNNLADSYNRLGYKKYYRVLDCSTFLEWRYYVELKEKKLINANFCKVRLCPMCAWRRSLKTFGQVSRVMDYVEENYDYKYIFLTLTVENCYGEDLRDTLDLMTYSFNKLTRRKAFKDAVKGYFRSLEVTYNEKRDDYHPHFHLILAVNRSYFTDDKIYLSQAKWTELWKQSLKVDYTPVVNVKRIKPNSDDKTYGKAVAETAKYTVKTNDYLIKDEEGKINEKITDKVVETLDRALHMKRLTSFGFKFKEVHKKLNLDDAEDGDLGQTHNEDEELRDDLFSVILRYQWNIGIKNYKLIEVAEDDLKEKE